MLAALVLLATPNSTNGECHPIEVTEWSPTGIAGCEVYGTGWASWWRGPGVATNACEWPWRECQPILVTSLDTGRTISVTPRMFGDLYSTTPRQRLVDLDPAALRALGLWEWRGEGLFRVVVRPLTSFLALLPNTALATPSK